MAHRERRDASAHPRERASADPPLVGAALHGLRLELRRLAPSGAPLLLCGPTGAGKGVAARWVHEISRREEPYVVLNCATVSEALFESQLFGHERGAFTGAISSAPGLFAAAGAGTVFLDEIGDMPFSLQAKLLRAIDERKARRVGATHEHDLFARVVAATHVALDVAVAERRFRADLLYRLGPPVHVPGLDERPGDIPEIVAALLGRLERPLLLAEGAVDWLTTQDWPGNVRELRYVLERAALHADGRPVGAPELARMRGRTAAPATLRPLKDVRREVEGRYVRAALAACGGNVTATAAKLGIGRSTVIKHRGAR